LIGIIFSINKICDSTTPFFVEGEGGGYISWNSFESKQSCLQPKVEGGKKRGSEQTSENPHFVGVSILPKKNLIE
jgi:hypothetical protein